MIAIAAKISISSIHEHNRDGTRLGHWRVRGRGDLVNRFILRMIGVNMVCIYICNPPPQRSTVFRV